MKKLVVLLGAVALIGCGEKKETDAGSVEASESASENPTGEPSADTAKHPPAESPVAESPSEEPSGDTPNSLSDADVERLLKEAVDMESLEERDDLAYQDNKPYSGWAKMIRDSGQVQALSQFKDGKPDGLFTVWAYNGQKVKEGILKDGKQHGPYTEWHENGQKATEVTFKDGEEVSTKHWNSKGEEVETAAEAFE